ncbi:hypothetical protein PF008_g10637 [Phytophthora fragariae]|uniref:Uncharacterized protein n=1 Tax=Phytophthora fragariae TaxID=53985 RepID=A0A6G0RU32_9STRA|nr:hypothetical protein PF008_g10637 [Phytophthora fragariae]
MAALWLMTSKLLAMSCQKPTWIRRAVLQRRVQCQPRPCPVAPMCIFYNRSLRCSPEPRRLVSTYSASTCRERGE